MRHAHYVQATSGGDITVTIYRDLNEAFVVFEGPASYTLSDLLVRVTYDRWLTYLESQAICWVSVTTSRAGHPIIRQLNYHLTPDHITCQPSRRRSPTELQDILTIISA